MANKNISDLPAGTALTGTERFEAEQPAATTNVFMTATQIQQSVAGRTPGGRLTLTTGTPVMAATVSGASTVYYTPYLHQFVPIWNGNAFVVSDVGGELGQATNDSVKSPAAVIASKNYDVFVWNDNGSFRATRGPPWTSDAVRGTGAGTSELIRITGVLVNRFAITNGPGGNLGTYVGTIRTNASGPPTVDWIVSAAGVGGSPGRLGVFNAYNRVPVSALCQDTTSTWTVINTTWRTANASANNSISHIDGLGDVLVLMTNSCATFTNGGVDGGTEIGVNRNATTGAPVICAPTYGASIGVTAMATCVAPFLPLLGYNTYYAMEAGYNVQIETFYGSGWGATATQTQYLSLVAFM